MNRQFCVIGNPIAHSISPKLHNLAYKRLDICANYSRVLLDDESSLKNTIFGYKLNGANITVPFKESAFKICDEIKGIAKEIKAINTIVNKDGKLTGFNTDAPGFLKSIEEFDSIKNVLILGAGGTARALSIILKHSGFNVVVVNRSHGRFDFFKAQGFTTFTHEDNLPDNFDLIINTTPAGLKDSNLPLPLHKLDQISKHARYGYDVVYNIKTPFLRFCNERNIKNKDGLEMLLYQAVLAFDIFFDNKYNKSDITNAMKDVFLL